jgi:tetratricopeptide (TPR) repeat protein
MSRILGRQPFRNTEKPAEVFRLLVNDACDGKTHSERTIREVVFSHPYDPLGTHVRTTVNTVRKMLHRYYKADGHNDYVVISLPVAKDGYPVHFRYNPHTAQFKIATDLLKSFTPRAVQEALALFDEILALYPDHFHARLGKTECLCLTAIYISNSIRRHELAQEALALARAVAAESPHEWQAHHMLGVAWLCNTELAQAHDAFERASKLALEKTSESLWVWMNFLFDQPPEEVEGYIFNKLVVRRVNDPLAWSLYAFCLYLKRDYEKAASAFAMAHSFDVNGWIPYLGLTFVCLALDRPEDALASYTHMNVLLTDRVGLLPFVGALAADRARKKAMAISAEIPSFTVPAYIADQLPVIMNAVAEERDDFQMAIMMLDSSPETAVIALRIAAHKRHPLTLLLRRWPLFETLWDREDFKQLIDDIGLIGT